MSQTFIYKCILFYFFLCYLSLGEQNSCNRKRFPFASSCPPTAFIFSIVSILGITPTLLWFTPFHPSSDKHMTTTFTAISTKTAITLLGDGRGASLRSAMPRIAPAADTEAQLSPVHAT
jgi:hypothetical protein